MLNRFPVSMRRFHGPVDAAYAAAVVGLETETFLERVRENTGLQNVGLLALEGENGSVQRDTWTASFRDVMYALDYPGQVGVPPVVTQPDIIPGRLIDIPDPNLRALLEEALGTQTIRPDAMATLTTLKASDRGIFNLAGLEFAVNLEELWISGNSVSDLSPLAGCTNLVSLVAWNTPLSSLSPLANLTKLERLEHSGRMSDISPLANLTNMKILRFYGDGISDASAIVGMTNLRHLQFRHHEVNDISPLAELFELETLDLHDNKLSDLSPLKNLTKLREVNLSHNRISDLSPLSMLTNLAEIKLYDNRISDVSPLAGLRNLRELLLSYNKIVDVSPLAGLTNLERLGLVDNKISDFSPVIELVENISWHNNPGFFAQAPKIEGPWLWVFLPNAKLESSTDLLSESSGGMITEVGVAINGAIEGGLVGANMWTSHKLPTTGQSNLDDMLGRPLPDGIIFGTVGLNSPREQNTTMYAGSRDLLKVWLNGVLIHERLDRPWLATDYNVPTAFFPATLRQGRNVLLVAAGTRSDDSSIAFLGCEPGADYSLAPNVGYVFSKTPIHAGDNFTLDIRAENVFDLVGWQFDIAFGPATLEAVDVSEGDFLKTDSGTTFFQGGRIDNAAGKITGLIAGRISEGGVSGSGTLLQVRLKAKSEGETELALQNFLFGSDTEVSIPAGPLEIRITVEERLLTGDVNRDGVVNILDLIRVARQLGKSVPSDSPVDINGDGVVNIFDLTLVAQGIGKTTDAAAPAIATGRADAATIEAWIAQARLADDGSIAFRQGIANLEVLLASMIPQETALLANYPNPFNPETWIPYQLAVPAEVTLTIYDMNGHALRRLAVGLQAAGMYQNRNRALYWDGRNGSGESVASGVYFYTLTSGEFTATRKMLIRK